MLDIGGVCSKSVQFRRIWWFLIVFIVFGIPLFCSSTFDLIVDLMQLHLTLGPSLKLKLLATGEKSLNYKASNFKQQLGMERQCLFDQHKNATHLANVKCDIPLASIQDVFLWGSKKLMFLSRNVKDAVTFSNKKVLFL